MRLIVSHKHRFIFVHSRKVAGSSLKVALAPFLGPDDIVIGSWNEILHSGVALNRHAEKVLKSAKARFFYWAATVKGRSTEEATNIGIKAHYRGRLSHNPPHPTAKEMKEFFPSEWRSYFKFSFVRNPFERLASDYWWRRRVTGKEFTFREYLELLQARNRKAAIIHPACASNWEMIAVDGTLEMDFVGRYEKLNEGFLAVCARLDIPADGLSSKQKVNPGVRDYTGMYGPTERQIAGALCAAEIECFKYGFPY